MNAHLEDTQRHPNARHNLSKHLGGGGFFQSNISTARAVLAFCTPIKFFGIPSNLADDNPHRNRSQWRLDDTDLKDKILDSDEST